MDKKQMKNLIRFGIKALGTIGVVHIGHNMMPKGLSPSGQIACSVAIIFAGMAFSDVMDAQILKYEQVIQQIANGGGDFIAF